MKSKSLLVVATHPVQYMAPWFRYLSEHTDLQLTVWYAMLPDRELQGVGFGQAFNWDTDLLSGYRWEQLENYSSKPSLNTFFGTRVKSIGDKLKSLSPAVVLVTGWHQLSLVQVAMNCRRANIPCLVRGESNNLKPRAVYKRILHRLFLKLFDGYLYIGQANRNFYLDNGVQSERLHFAPYFVDNKWFSHQLDNSGPVKEQWLEKFKIALDERVILFVGKLQQKKNVAELIQAVALLSSNKTRYCLVVTGDGEQRERLQGIADQLNIRTVFTGFVNQGGLAEVYASADCIVLPSDYGETWGLVVNEAMNFSLPVVVSDRVGCGADLVREGQTGYRYSFGQPAQLAAILEKVCHSESDRRKLGEGAKHRIQQYSMEVATRGLLNAIYALQE
ncbi:MAG: glycosyltransferase family 4 protein [bacterium]